MSPPTEATLRIGRAIDVVRRQRGLQNDELADLAGVSPASISRWQHGHVQMGLPGLQAVADALRVPVSLLLEPPPDDDDLRIAVVLHDAAQRAARPGVSEP